MFNTLQNLMKVNTTQKIILMTAMLFTYHFSVAQNVGVGIINPSEKLDVAGNTKANNFIYSIPKTFNYAVSGFDFRAEKSTDTVIVTIGAGEVTMQTNLLGKRIVAPVHLPDGATMVNLKAYIDDFSSTVNLRVTLYRKTLLDNFFADSYG